MLANRFENLSTHQFMLSEQQFLLPSIKNFEQFSYFVAFCFFKNYEIWDFGTQLVQTMFHLNLTGSTRRFLLFQKMLISQKLRFVGDQNITILTLKTGLFMVCFTKNDIEVLIQAL